MIRKIFLFFIFWKVLVYLFAYLATFILPLNKQFITNFEFKEHQPYLIWIWGNFDGDYYLEIAKSGYKILFSHPFFPFYPLLIRSIHSLAGLAYIISAEIISNLSLILSLIIFSKLLFLDKKTNLLNLMLFTVILFPTSLFYGAVYNDALFLLFASLTIYFSRKGSWVWASFAGSLATLTRLNGLALVFIIFFEYLARKPTFSVKNIIRSKIWAITLVPLAFLSYLLYTHTAYGDWHLVFSSMKAWNQEQITLPLQVFWRYLKIIAIFQTSTLTYWRALGELFFVLFYIFMLIGSYGKIRFSYWIFFVISIIIPSLTGTFQGMPRYGLHLYPFFLSLALFLNQKGRLFKLIYFTVAILLLFLFTTLFTRGYFVA